jgi:hypothetical protein
MEHALQVDAEHGGESVGAEVFRADHEVPGRVVDQIVDAAPVREHGVGGCGTL